MARKVKPFKFMGRIFDREKKTTRTQKEYIEIFETLMRNFEAVADKTMLFEDLVDGLDLAFHVFRGEKTIADYCHLIEERIGRPLTPDEKIKTEILVNASKSKFVSLHTGRKPLILVRKLQKHQVHTIDKRWITRHRKDLSDIGVMRIVKKTNIRKRDAMRKVVVLNKTGGRRGK